MNKRKQAKPSSSVNRRPAARTARKRWPVYCILPVFGALLVSGFFLAGQKHFASMDYGMKNSRLKKQIEALEAEKRRLILAREVSLSPTEIKRAAKKTGLLEAGDLGPEIASAATPGGHRAAAPRSVTPGAALVVKTASVAPASAPKPSTATYSRTARREAAAKKTAVE